MKSEHQQLLDDVLDEAAPPDFNEALWQNTLEAVRYRNRARHRNRALLAVAVAVTVPLLLWHRVDPPAPMDISPLPYGIVRSQPLPASMIVETKPDSIPFITSSVNGVAVIKTDPAAPLFREIDDEQLLTLLAGRPAALVREIAGPASLKFVNPEDQDGFPVP